MKDYVVIGGKIGLVGRLGALNVVILKAGWKLLSPS